VRISSIDVWSDTDSKLDRRGGRIIGLNKRKGESIAFLGYVDKGI
jgi:hypothetical protein